MDYERITQLLTQICHVLWPVEYVVIRWIELTGCSGRAYFFDHAYHIDLHPGVILDGLPWLLCHELGHCASGHCGPALAQETEPTPDQSGLIDALKRFPDPDGILQRVFLPFHQEREAQADAWAAAALARFEQAHGQSILSILNEPYRAAGSSPAEPK